MSEQQRQVYFRLSPEEDRQMWQAFREGRATAALNHIITTHVAREHHAGQAERADAWDALRRLASDWQENGNSRGLGDPTAGTWHEAARQLLAVLDGKEPTGW